MDQAEPGGLTDAQLKSAAIRRALDLATAARRDALNVLIYAAEVYTEAVKVCAAAHAAVHADHMATGTCKPEGK